MAKILTYPELRVNPFRDRICKVFSSSNDGDCTFEDFLDMMSVFSEMAPKAVKAEHAFRIFGKLTQMLLCIQLISIPSFGGRITGYAVLSIHILLSSNIPWITEVFYYKDFLRKYILIN